MNLLLMEGPPAMERYNIVLTSQLNALLQHSKAKPSQAKQRPGGEDTNPPSSHNIQPNNDQLCSSCGSSSRSTEYKFGLCIYDRISIDECFSFSSASPHRHQRARAEGGKRKMKTLDVMSCSTSLFTRRRRRRRTC